MYWYKKALLEGEMDIPSSIRVLDVASITRLRCHTLALTKGKSGIAGELDFTLDVLLAEDAAASPAVMAALEH